MAEGEFHENEIRKDFNASERVAIGRTLKTQLGKRQGRRNDLPANAGMLQGETDDHVADIVGFGSAETYARAEKVVDRGAPELVAAMDTGAISISAAARRPKKSPAGAGLNCEGRDRAQAS